VTFVEPYHVGVVVAELDAAAGEFEQLLNVRWAAPKRETTRIWTPAGVLECTFRYTYSRNEGLPLIELIEAHEGTPWWPGDGVKAVLHHIGFWANPLAPTAAALESLGAPIEAAMRSQNGEPKVFSYHQLTHGPRIELVDPGLKESLRAWLTEAE